MSNGKTVACKKDIANGFNDFFVNVGPNLAKDINIPNENTHVLDYLKSQNPASMFLASVEESEVINVVKNCKNKKSAGYDGIDMTVINPIGPRILLKHAFLFPGFLANFEQFHLFALKNSYQKNYSILTITSCV